MSQMIPKDQIENGDIFGMLIDDGSIFNIQILQAGLGVSLDTAQRWCNARQIKPLTGKGSATWIFSGSTFRAQLEKYAAANGKAEARRSGPGKKPARRKNAG